MLLFGAKNSLVGQGSNLEGTWFNSCIGKHLCSSVLAADSVHCLRVRSHVFAFTNTGMHHAQLLAGIAG